jgi:uncharacterized protein
VVARVVELNRYPIKGCAANALSDAQVRPAGLAHDRSFMIVDAEGAFRSQRTDSRLALIRPEVGLDGHQLTLHAPDIDEIRIDVDTSAARREVLMFGNPYQAIDQGNEVADWLSTALGAPSRLVRVPPEHARITDGMTPGTSGFADSTAVHLVSRSSLRALNERIAGRGGDPVPMSRFRVNIVVEGWDEPHEEDRTRRIGIGGVELGYGKLAIRCAVTLVDQRAGRKAGLEPLRTLADYRRAGQGDVAFGIKLAVLQPGKCSVGDEVVVSSWDASEL